MSKYPEGVAIICSNNDDMALAAARTAKDNPNYAKTIFLGFAADDSRTKISASHSGTPIFLLVKKRRYMLRVFL